MVDKVRTVMYCALKDWNAGNSLRSGAGNNGDGKQATNLMKRLATWAFYAVGALAIAYLALYAYAVFTGRDLQPGDPIHIFRKPDAPSYSGNCLKGMVAASAREAVVSTAA
jgi:hypothetical protein